jgi:SPP1 family predicted phage head-tail adaptor
VWGKVEPASGMERFSMGQERADVSHVVTIRYCSGVKPNMHITFTRDSVTHTLKIVNVLNDAFRDAAMTLLCTEVDVSAAEITPRYHVLTFNWANDTTAAADSDWLDVFSEYTIEFWMRTATASIPATQTIIAKWGTTTGNQSFRVDLTTARKLSVTTRCSVAAANRTWTSTAAVIDDTAWHHYAVTLSSTVTVYKDGVAVAGGGDTLGVQAIQQGSATLTIGNRNSSGGYSFYGSLAVIRLWNYERTAEQVLTDKGLIELGSTYAGAQPIDPGLVAEWTAAANDELTFPDKSGNSNTLTVGTGTTKPTLTAAYTLPVSGGVTP